VSPDWTIGQWHAALARLVDAAHLERPDGLGVVLQEAVRPLGIETTVYVVDREQRMLRALPAPGRPPRDPLSIDSTLPGRAFATVSVLPSMDPPVRLWVPVVDGTERLGVLDVVLPDDADPADPGLHEGATLLAGLIGHVLMAKSVYGDSLHVARRSRPMSVAAELLWQMLPPLTFITEGMVLSAVLEPCYDVGGDAFDYAVDGPVTRMAVFDSVGHGLPAALTSAVALSATRSCRRSGGDLVEIARAADEAIAQQFPDFSFATAVLAELENEHGVLRYVNAGHPAPLLLRHGRAVLECDEGRRVPLGLASMMPEPVAVEPAEQALEPGDRLLFYTDGVTEARNRDGEPFGLARLVDLAERISAELPAAETLRRLCHATLEFQPDQLGDDATLMLVEWSPDAVAQNLPE